MPDDNFLDRWEKQLRAISQLNNLVRPDVGRSYPLPAYTDRGVELRHFYHVATQTGPNSMYLSAPALCAVISFEDGALLALFPATELGLALFEETIYTVPDTKKPAIRSRVQRLPDLYDRVMALYPYQPNSGIGEEFWDTLQGVVPPVFVPYYEALSPDFVAWCQAIAPTG